jgi:hypothetical protein
VSRLPAPPLAAYTRSDHGVSLVVSELTVKSHTQTKWAARATSMVEKDMQGYADEGRCANKQTNSWPQQQRLRLMLVALTVASRVRSDPWTTAPVPMITSMLNLRIALRA